MTLNYFLRLLALFLLLNGCSTNSRYSQHNDSIPSRMPTSEEMADATPKAEPLSRGGNKDYNVWGKNYRVLPKADGYTNVGVASWYGEKFHGHFTSNGEVYDMYSMTAAHKSLPLPSFVRVTNLENNKQIIVRVNDRGPFHEDRIIDLSFSAAYKLDMLKKGTAKVKVEAITDFNQGQVQVAAIKKPEPFITVAPPINNPKLDNKSYIQVFATKNQTIARNTAKNLRQMLEVPVHLPIANGIFRVQLGPIENKTEMDNLIQRLRTNGYPEAYAVN